MKMIGNSADYRPIHVTTAVYIALQKPFDDKEHPSLALSGSL